MGKSSRKIRSAVLAVTAAVGAMAVVQQLRRPRAERTWHGRVLGIPYDFRRPTLQRLRDEWWNPSAPLFTPHSFGIGWSVNLYRLSHCNRSLPGK